MSSLSREIEDFYNILMLPFCDETFRELRIEQQLVLSGMYIAFKRVSVKKDIYMDYMNKTGENICENTTALVREQIKEEMVKRILTYIEFNKEDEEE